MVSASMKAQLKREIEELEKRFKGPVPANMRGSALYSEANYYSDIESLIRQKKKELYGGSKKKQTVINPKTKKPAAKKKVISNPKPKKSIKISK